ncbi:matrilin-2-like [Montipora capricornis]|uniref:matrilin-2-like n=1 Tax=Montipora capricornis TaxID=246305 RepID=UPI0035F141BD
MTMERVKFEAAILCFLAVFMCGLEPGDARSKRVRITIPKSLLIFDSQGIGVIRDANEMTKKAVTRTSQPVFMEDYHFVKRIAIVEKSLNRTSKEGGLWNVDKCAFKATQTKRKENRQLAALHKTVRRTFGVTWSKIKYSDLRRPLYSVLAACIVLEMANRPIPRGLKNQARFWLESYHGCAENQQGWDEVKSKFMRAVKSSCHADFLNCEHSCHESSTGQAECRCRDGYTLQSDGTSCAAGASRSPGGNDPLQSTETECKNGLKCEHKCIAYEGKPQCMCRDGYQLHMNGYSCVDIDECRYSPCSQLCTNTPGSFSCSCRAGFDLQSDKTTCQDEKTKCLPNDIACIEKCNKHGNCSCPPGTVMAPDGKTCAEVNACDLFKGVCHQDCVNTPTGYRCTCSAGYELNDNGVSCSDIDECSRGIHRCQHNCRNVPGSYFCSCKRGFRLSDDLKSCVDINECALYPGICPYPSRCRNTVGGHTCDCPKGFVSDRQKICVDEDECANSNGGCSQRCDNFPGSFRCSCVYGYTLQQDRKTCKDIDECSKYSFLCQHKCVNTAGSYKCVCPETKKEHPNGFLCI